MSVAIAIFVKTPNYLPIKTRLAATIGRERAESFYRLCICAMEGVMKELASVVDVETYWAVAEKEAVDEPIWQGLTPMYTGDGELGERLHCVYSKLFEQHSQVMLLGADAPQLTVGFLKAVFDQLSSVERSFSIGPARDGGFYLFAGNQSVSKGVWLDTPYSVSDTASVLAKKLETEGNLFFLPEFTDVDVEADLSVLCGELEKAELPEQRQLLEWLIDFETL